MTTDTSAQPGDLDWSRPMWAGQLSFIHDRAGSRLLPGRVRGSRRTQTLTDGPICRKYLVSSPIIPWYYTQLIGDARTPPTLVASASFSGSVIDADPYLGENLQWYTNQNNLCVVSRSSVGSFES
jgi:hypothetical protein